MHRTFSFAAAALAGTSAFAGPLSSNFADTGATITAGPTGSETLIDTAALMANGELAVNINDGSFTWSQTNDFGGSTPGWVLSNANISLDPDPFINVAFSFTNVSGIDQSFVVSSSLFSSVDVDPAIASGTVEFTLTDTSDNGVDAAADFSISGDSIYNGFFGGDGDVLDLLLPGDPQLPLAATFFPATSDSASASSGIVAVPALSTGEEFGIDFEFFLTAGDTVTVNSTFVIVPEPASGLLLGLAGAAAMIRRRNA
ncbi:MAG: PEP-CTERM sorting domain-containing protein [Planctomycetota bacterium]